MHSLRHWNWKTQLSTRPLCTIQLFSAWPHQVQWCAAGLLQPVPCETTLRQSSIGPRYDSASRYWQWCIRGHARFSLVRTGFAPFLCLSTKRPGPNRLTVLSCRRWKHMTILRMVIIDIIVIFVFIAFIFVLFNNCNYCHYAGYYNYSDYWPYCIY